MKFIIIIAISFCIMSCSNNQSENLKISHQIDSLSSCLNGIINNYQLSYRFENEYLNPGLIMLDKDFDTCKITSVFNNSDRLYFHFTDFECSPCLNFQLERLLKYQSEYGKDYLCLLGNVQSFRTMGQLARNFGFKCDIYIIPNEQNILANLPKFNESFYFTINQQGALTLTHFPEVVDSTTTDIFLKTVVRKLGIQEK